MIDENPADLSDRELELISRYAIIRVEREAKSLGIDTSDPEWAKKSYPVEIQSRIPHLSLEEVSVILEKTRRDLQKITDELNPPIDLIPDEI